MTHSENGWKEIMAKSRPHYPRNFKQIQENAIAKAVKHTDSIPTLPDGINTSSTLEDSDTDDEERLVVIDNKTQKNIKNRVIFHFKKNWLNWVVGLVIMVSLYFFRDFQKDIVGIQKDISSNTKDIDENTSDIDNMAKDISDIKSKVTSLNDRFEMVINLFLPRNNQIEKTTK